MINPTERQHLLQIAASLEKRHAGVTLGKKKKKKAPPYGGDRYDT